VNIGILGGTFDPVHNAHLAMARAALDALGLNEILFLPTGTPRYRAAPVAEAKHRAAMLKLALAGEPRYRVDEREIKPGASAYTVDTLRSLRTELGAETEIYFLMGADQYQKLDSWHRPDQLRQLAKIALFERPGIKIEDPQVKVVAMKPMNISASDIRARAARGETLAGLVPPAVANYVAQHRLYS
jgi:nicotinate-nucleotide adenylyltransferase